MNTYTDKKPRKLKYLNGNKVLKNIFSFAEAAGSKRASIVIKKIWKDCEPEPKNTSFIIIYISGLGEMTFNEKNWPKIKRELAKFEENEDWKVHRSAKKDHRNHLMTKRIVFEISKIRKNETNCKTDDINSNTEPMQIVSITKNSEVISA